MAICFGSLDFIINKEEMTRASEDPSPLASNLLGIARSLGDLRLDPPQEDHGSQVSPPPDRTDIVGVLDHIQDSFLDILLSVLEYGLTSLLSEARCDLG
jgi:hypothetical protein